jgi:putative nucleotidyltransferase with HDIG domain
MLPQPAEPSRTSSLDSPPSASQDAILRKIRDIPSLPEIVNRILTLLSHSETPASQIANLVAYDPGLTSKVLRMVNSAAYGFQRQISSIQHAIMMLGFNTVRGLVLSASIFKLFEGQTHPHGLDHKKFWEHSMTTAVIARFLTKKFRLMDMDDVFSAAMLHDIGKVVLDVYLPNYAEALQAARKEKVPFHGEAFRAIEQEKLGLTHDGIGALLAGKWRFPISITEVIQFHHKPWESEACPQVVYVVSFANELAHLIRAELGPAVFSAAYFSPSILEYFQLEDEESLEALFREAQEAVEDAGDLLGAIAN